MARRRRTTTIAAKIPRQANVEEKLQDAIEEVELDGGAVIAHSIAPSGAGWMLLLTLKGRFRDPDGDDDEDDD